MEARTSSSALAVAPTDIAHQAGEVVDGRYVLLEPLGKGGMGVVWKARSAALGVEVALKLLNRSQTGGESSQRMAREAHAAARLGHPAMVTVLDFGTTSAGDPYVAMELLRGDSLADVLQREHRVEATRAVAILLPIIDGLGAAHDKGIVHRDVKPENLFISKDAQGRVQPKLLDFGIAKLEQLGEQRQRLTMDGTVLGSPGYFSPEQARGQADIDSRTDIWSISVVLYELITGELPFSGANYNALLMSILKHKPTSLMAQDVGDEALWKIIKQGLAKERKQRWSSMWELGQALAFWLYQHGVRTDVASRSLKEAWLEAEVTGVRMQVHSAPPRTVNRGNNSTTRSDRAAADAGETVSTLIRRHAVQQGRLSWGVLALGACAAFWAVTSPQNVASAQVPESLPQVSAAQPPPLEQAPAAPSAANLFVEESLASRATGGRAGRLANASATAHATAPLARRASEPSRGEQTSGGVLRPAAAAGSSKAPPARLSATTLAGVAATSQPAAAPASAAKKLAPAAHPRGAARVDKEFGF